MPRIVIVLMVAIAASVAAAASALAAAPVHSWVTIDETFTWDDCGFTVEEHDVARLHIVEWYDESGARERRLVTAPGATITWTNPETGASVTSANPFVVRLSDNADGSATIAFTGLVFALHGGGSAYVTSGRQLILFSTGGIELLSSVGPEADLCEALSATIG